ncbi:uncharacterized protein ZBAI_07280 [Zygosaccharomyces bailii ISA1307]|nr:uncharacterized protein ZBAI_07280 [Zygosaccharomyces bailii ISA1307]
MLSFQQARQLVESGKLERLERSPECTALYRKHKEGLTEDIVVDVCKKLHWSLQDITFLNTVKYPEQADKIAAAFSDAALFKITVNEFPYWFEPCVSHLLIWSKISLPLYCGDSEQINTTLYKKIEEFLRYNLEQRLGISSEDYCFFINTSRLQSVKGISHIHLLLRSNQQVAREILSQQLEPLID